jgi:hypothetical protein
MLKDLVRESYNAIVNEFFGKVMTSNDSLKLAPLEIEVYHQSTLKKMEFVVAV